MVNSLKQFENEALESGHMHSGVSHRRDSYVAIWHLHRGASIDYQEDVKTTIDQIERCLQDADVRFSSINDNLSPVQACKVRVDFWRQHREL